MSAIKSSLQYAPSQAPPALVASQNRAAPIGHMHRLQKRHYGRSGMVTNKNAAQLRGAPSVTIKRCFETVASFVVASRR